MKINGHSLTRHAAIALFMATAAGCAQHAPFQAIDAGAEIRLTISGQQLPEPQAMDMGESIGSNVVGGMGGGAYMGFDASQACGAFAIFCAPVFAAVGATAGAIVGLAYGAATGLPEEKAEAVEDLMSALVSGDAPLAASFRDEVLVEFTSKWRVVTTTEVPEVLVSPLYIVLEQKADDKLKFSVHAAVAVRYGPRPKKDTTEAKQLQVSTPTHHVDDWIAEDGAILNLEMEKTVRRLAQQMSASLAYSM